VIAVSSVALPQVGQIASAKDGLSPAALAWRRFRRHRMALTGSAMLLFVLLYVTLGGLFFSRGTCHGTGQYLTGEAYANCNDIGQKLQSPSRAHPFGTDTIGRDVLARTIYGGQISVIIGLTAALLEIIIGTLVGAAAGYYGGWIDSLLMRLTEAMLNIPSLFLLIVGAKFFGNRIPELRLAGRVISGSVIVIVLIIGLTSWMYLARIVRASILSLKEQDFVSAARCLGVSNTRIIFAHLIPNSIAPVIVSATLGVANAILQEAYVSFLGLGVQPPTASWGNMLDSAYKYLESAPWLWIFPGLFILLTVLSVNFVGDGLRDAVDPRSTGVGVG
jgi:peptide/nickel transport system permease protein